MGQGTLIDNQAFSVATLLYARMRRVSGRVVDALYLAENKNYAQHIIRLAVATEDAELIKLAQRLSDLLGLDEAAEEKTTTTALLESSMPTEEEVYRAQVSHHYIGALR